MIWQKAIVYTFFVLALISMVFISIYTLLTIYMCMCGDIVAHHRRTIASKRASHKPTYERDEHNPKIVYFYPKGK
jgi:hypothetical protein